MGKLGTLLFVASLSFSSFALAQEETTALPQAVTAEAEQTPEAKEADAAANKTLRAVDNRKESDIPLNLDGNRKASNEGGSGFRIMFTLLVLGVVGTGAYFFIKRYRIPKASKHQTQIKVLQQHFLGPKKSLAIIRVAGESILIGVTDHNINMIKSLSLMDDEIPNEAPQNFNKVLTGLDGTPDFEEEDEKPSKKNSRKTSAALDEDEEFAISGIKDIVSKRLKDMRNLR